MSDNVPFEIQIEIIKKVSDVKYLIQFRSVSKTWKSFIDSSEFVKGYGARNTQPHTHILKYEVKGLSDHKYICLVDDDNQSFKVQEQQWKSFIDSSHFVKGYGARNTQPHTHILKYKVDCVSDHKYIRLVDDDNQSFKVQQQEFSPFVMSPLIEQYGSDSFVIGMCHGLMALHCYHKVYKSRRILAIWNPFIGKSFGIALPRYEPHMYIPTSYGLGVCPVTSDPTIVKIEGAYNKPLRFEVFTLSSGVWNVIPVGHLSRQSIKVYGSGQAVDRFIYWGARETTVIDRVVTTINHMVLSFDLITKEFKMIDLPDSLINELLVSVSVSKLRESLVVYGAINVMDSWDQKGCGVWVMDHDSSFRKLFTIRAPVSEILGFSKTGEAIFEIENGDLWCSTLKVYDPCSQRIKNLGIDGLSRSFFIGTYKESLLLLDQLDSHIFQDNIR